MIAKKENSVKERAIFLHLSLLSYWIVPLPFSGIIAPLLIWQLSRENYPQIDPHGRNAINWIISSTVYKTILFVTVVGIALLPFIAGLELVFPVIAAIKAKKDRDWKYPLSIDFLGSNAERVFRRAAVGFLSLCIIPLAGFIGSAVWMKRHSSWLNNMSSVNGTVFELREKTDEDGDSLYKPVISFQDSSGETYRMSPSYWSGSPSPKEGDSINVLYAPADPEQAIIDAWANKWLLVTLALSISATLLVFSALPSFLCLLVSRFS